jgi:molybdopterin-guanine dinucleotide biosynthesis adapter protein
MKKFGITGWKNAGKTSLIERLVAEFVARGLRVSTLKHAHHTFEIDHEGRDTFRHRSAGAAEVLVSSGTRWALMSELRGDPEPALDELIAKMTPVDLVLIEGWKASPHPKLEVWRAETGHPLIAPGDKTIRAVASDASLDLKIPVLDLNNTMALADFVQSEAGI